MTSTTGGPRFRGKEVDVVIDVRSHLEYWLGHLPGALCVPVTTLPDALAKQRGVSRTSRILVYCASGSRSASAAETLKSAGYQHVVDAGGIAAAREHFAPASA